MLTVGFVKWAEPPQHGWKVEGKRQRQKGGGKGVKDLVLFLGMNILEEQRTEMELTLKL